MADSVVTFMLQNLTQLINQQSSLLGGVEDQVTLLASELSFINVFLKNTNWKRHDNELVKEVVRQIRDVAYEAEDVIDTYIATVTKHGRRSVLKKVIHSVDRAIALRGVANKIERIKNVIKVIYENRDKFGIVIAESSGGGDAEAEKTLHRHRREVKGEQVVGFARDTEALVKQLIEGSSQRIVVSIVGMGGLGKTTLAKKIYNNNDVKNYFNFRGWVYVSQKYRIRDLLLEILEGVTTPMPRVMFRTGLKLALVYGLGDIYSLNKDKLDGRQFEDFMDLIKEMNDEEFKKEWSMFWESKLEHQKLKNSLSRFVKDFYSNNGVKLKDMTDDELKIVLSGSLRSKRYLLVMDDIWSTEAWNEVSAAFPKNSNGSRILITTQIKGVALRASGGDNYIPSGGDNYIPSISPHEPQFLGNDESWELFSKVVFGGGTCPPNLELLGKEIVTSCKGLPLAIVVLGGLLANKDSPHIWSKWIGNKLYLTEDRLCKEILALSYNDLPCRLKPCFLYFGFFPEGFEIPVRQLIRLWIAEGFIQQIGDTNMEDAAESYLEELIDRSLIQVATKRSDGGVKTCRIHNLVRDFCISESTEENFLEVRSDNHSSKSKFYRISIHCANYPCLYFKPYVSSNCRSLIGFGEVVGSKSLGESYLKYLCKNNKLARVVDLSKMGICYSIPKKIKKLILLRYLSIQSGELHVIPNSICKLWNLETLDMRNSNSEEGNFKIKCLPKGIWELQKLRHLYLNGRTSLPRTDNAAGLPNLQVLSGIALNPDSESLIAKSRFPNVRKLGLCATTNGMSNLLSSLCPLQYLQNLKVYKFFLKPPPSPFQLTITKITLVGATLTVDIIGVLGSLTKLRVLKVVGDVPGAINNLPLDCNANSFRQLEVFKMADMLVTLWSMGEGAMPSLQRLVIKSCEFVTMPPENLLTALRDVKVLHPSPPLATMLRQLQMKDGCKLQVYPSLPN